MENLKLKVLIAEDDDFNILLLKMILRGIASEIVVARNGWEALEQFRKHPDTQLVLMDLMMPEMNGFEATRNIREQDNSVVIIVQTSLTSKSDQKRAQKSGCNSYLNKPVSGAALMELINHYFDQSELMCN